VGRGDVQAAGTIGTGTSIGDAQTRTREKVVD